MDLHETRTRELRPLEGTSGGRIERCPACHQLCRVLLRREGQREEDGVPERDGKGPGGGQDRLQPDL